MRDLIEKFSVTRDWYPTFATLIYVARCLLNFKASQSLIRLIDLLGMEEPGNSH